MKIYFFVYRNWAFQIAKKIKKKFQLDEIKIFSLKNNEINNFELKKNKVTLLDEKKFNNFFFNLKSKKPDVLFFLGWSRLINSLVYKKFLCICMHPSKLPLFRGGSPIQNQIINNITKSGITLFKINKFIDGGPITHQVSLLLNGDIKTIFYKIEKKGFHLIKKFIKDFKSKKIFYKKQNLKDKKIYKRRTPNLSFIPIESLKNKNYLYIKNFIRMLGNPYPNAFIIVKNKKILIQKIKKTKKKKPNIFDINPKVNDRANGYILNLKDTNIEILKSNII